MFESNEEDKDIDKVEVDASAVVEKDKAGETAEKAPEKPKPPKKKKMTDSEKIKQLTKAVHYLASMMGAETFAQAKEAFPILTDSE